MTHAFTTRKGRAASAADRTIAVCLGLTLVGALALSLDRDLSRRVNRPGLGPQKRPARPLLRHTPPFAASPSHSIRVPMLHTRVPRG